MSPTVLLLHAYSSHNRGDGLLVDESLELIREALGGDVSIEIAASDPESFEYLGLPVYLAKPGRRGWDRRYRALLRDLGRFDLIVGVGGGYLRAGHPVEFLKCLLVMGPQLRAAARSRRPTVYLPQSVGPFRMGTRALFRSWLKRLGRLWLRDDRSVAEVDVAPAQRSSDLAIVSPGFTATLAPEHQADVTVGDTVILTVRRVRGEAPPLVRQLASLLRFGDVPLAGYVQSSVGGNDDTEVQRQLTGGGPIGSDEYLRRGEHASAPPRVVVAVRMHAALMAIRAGHFVVHLAYERKGFSAFADLGLSDWVHNVNSFDPEEVARQVRSLLEDEATRRLYRERLRQARPLLEGRHSELVASLRDAYGR